MNINPFQFTTEGQEKFFMKYAEKRERSVKSVKESGTTLLHCAVSLGQVNCVKSLVGVGVGIWAGVHATDYDGNTPLHAACLAVCSDYDYDIFDDDTWIDDHAPHLSRISRNLDEKRTLLASRYRRNDSTLRFSESLISIFIDFPKRVVKIVQLLISAGASVRVPNKNGLSPLHCLAHNPELDDDTVLGRGLVELFASQGANFNAKTADGSTPLHYAVAYEWKTRLVKYLVSSGVSVNVKNDAGKTPLDIAKEHRCTDVIEYLESGDRFSLENFYTPLFPDGRI